MLTQALGCKTIPVYLVFQSDSVPHLCLFEAKVVINPGPSKDGRPLVFIGKPMPTTVLAVHTAAVEAITRLRFQFPQVAETREFRYLPSPSKASREFFNTAGEADPALARLVQFIEAQGLLIGGIIREFQSLDRDNNDREVRPLYVRNTVQRITLLAPAPSVLYCSAHRSISHRTPP
jgi:hypothetical protein